MSDRAILGGAPVRTQPFPSWPQDGPDDRDRLLEVLESRNWGGYSFPNRYADEFAQKFAAAHGAEYGCCVANGALALVAALQAAAIRFDEVIVPAYTRDGASVTVLFAGAVPVFCDVGPATCCLDIDHVPESLTPGAKAVIPVHLAMRFTDMDDLVALGVERDLLIIEDCAHAHCGEYTGRGAGFMGDLGCFSFQSSKIMTAGERWHRDHLPAGVFRTAAITYELQAGQRHRFLEGPRGPIDLPDHGVQAALLLGQLERLPELEERHSQNARLLSCRLAEIPGLSPLPPQPAITREAIYKYVFRYEETRAPRDLFVAALEREGVPCDGRFYEPVYRSDLFQVTSEAFLQVATDDRSCRCPVAERAAWRQAAWLPPFLLLGDAGAGRSQNYEPGRTPDARKGTELLMYISMNGTLVAGGKVPWPDFARLAAKTGFKGTDVNISAAIKEGADATERLLSDLHIAPAVVGLPVEFRKDEETFQRDLKGLDAAAQFAAAINCPRMTTYFLPSSELPKPEQRRIYKARWTACAGILAKHNVRFGLEFVSPVHLRKRFPHEFIYRMDETLELAKECGPNVGVLLDSWHWYHAGATLKDIESAGLSRIVHVQVADSPQLPPERIMDNERLMPGEGVIDLAGFFRMLKKIGYKDGVSPEIFGRGLKNMAPEEGAKLGLETTASVMRKAGAL